MGEQVDRPLRSVFVGNIPYEVTEEKLKEIFSEVGPVLSLKLVYDRETGKPKGYGFCEYKDVETAMSAMRNLNGYEINGRVLRVDNAGAERHRMAEMGGGGMGGGGQLQQQQQQQQQQNGPRHDNDGGFINQREEGPPPPEKAPEVISKAVASLPPEQMFEIMKQMKLCIQNNPSEARNMLLQNPQLAYALLQALVVMKIVDPPTAISMLHKDNAIGMGSLLPEGQVGQMNMMGGGGGGGFGAPPTDNPWIAAAGGSGTGVPLMPPNPPGPFGAGPGPVPPPNMQGNISGGDMDLRQMDPRLRNQGQGGGGGGGGGQDFDLRDPRSQSDRFPMDRRDRDLRDMRDRDMRADRDLRNERDLRGDPRTDRDMRDRDLRAPLDPRAARRQGGNTATEGSSSTASAAASSAASKAAAAFPGMAGLGPGATDKEKANLIMQVLQLSDEQINVLPAEQRQSILVLKEQIAKSASQGR